MNKEIYLAGGCFWGIEKLFQSIDGVVDAKSGYANGKEDIIPTYDIVLQDNTEYKETVKVIYDDEKVNLKQLLKAFFYVIDPTVENRQANDIGTQYQTGIYYIDDISRDIILEYVAKEKEKHDRFVVQIEELTRFFDAEEYHQDYLDKNPTGYCHIVPTTFAQINKIIKESEYKKPSDEYLRENLTPLQYDITQNSATEKPFSGEYYDFFEKGIYVDITTGEPLFSSLDKYHSTCGWPSFCEPIDKDNVIFKEDKSYGMDRTEVRSKSGDAHLGHIFYNQPESPNGVRYCINSACLRFIPYERLDIEGYGEWKEIFDNKG